MNSPINQRVVAATVAAMIIISCSDDPNDPSQNPNTPPPPPGGNTEVTITSVPNGVFWGDELTITGTGFSTVKEENLIKFTKLPPLSCSLQYTSGAGGDIEIISASATQLKIKVPLRKISDNPVCGPHKADIEITVNGKTAKHEGVTFGPLPYVGEFSYHYGWFDVPKVTRIGDSVMLNGGLLATGPKDSEYWDDLRLSVDGKSIPIKFRSIGLESGWAFLLPPEEFASPDCSDEPDGWRAREMTFTFHIQGTDKKASRKLFVQNWPQVNASCYTCPPNISLSNPLPQHWVIRGKNMSFSGARFVPVNATTTAAQSISVTSSAWTNEIAFEIPLSILTADYQYSVYLTNKCDTTSVGQLTIIP
jgi:hypothetical protein